MLTATHLGLLPNCHVSASQPDYGCPNEEVAERPYYGPAHVKMVPERLFMTPLGQFLRGPSVCPFRRFLDWRSR